MTVAMEWLINHVGLNGYTSSHKQKVSCWKNFIKLLMKCFHNFSLTHSQNIIRSSYSKFNLPQDTYTCTQMCKAYGHMEGHTDETNGTHTLPPQWYYEAIIYTRSWHTRGCYIHVTRVWHTCSEGATYMCSEGATCSKGVTEGTTYM